MRPDSAGFPAVGDRPPAAKCHAFY